MIGRSREEREAIIAKVSESLDNPSSIKDLRDKLGIEPQKRKQSRDRGRRERLPEVSYERQYQSIGQGSTGVANWDRVVDDLWSHGSNSLIIKASTLQPPETNLFQEHEKHIQAVSFCDAFGDWYRFPYSTVRGCAGMHQCILQASKGTGEDHEALVRDAKYSLVDSAGYIILPEYWSINVWPGLAVHMQMWSRPPTSEKPKARHKKRSKRHIRTSFPDQDWERAESSSEEEPYPRTAKLPIDRRVTMPSSLRRSATSNDYVPKPLGSIREEQPISHGSRVSWAADSTVPQQQQQQHEQSDSESSRSRSRSHSRSSLQRSSSRRRPTYNLLLRDQPETPEPNNHHPPPRRRSSSRYPPHPHVEDYNDDDNDNWVKAATAATATAANQRPPRSTISQPRSTISKRSDRILSRGEQRIYGGSSMSVRYRRGRRRSARPPPSSSSSSSSSSSAVPSSPQYYHYTQHST